jgi:serine O-acetyltransferase
VKPYNIASKQQYREFRNSDRKSLGLNDFRVSDLGNEIFVLQARLRKLEYVLNCSRSRLRIIWRKYLFRRSSLRLGVSISPNTFGPGLAIAHRGNIVVNGGARIGQNCRIHVGVNIGTRAGEHSAAPRIGANCYLGPGAKLFGEITIGDNTVIGANAVVNRSFPEGNQTIGGIPARVLSDKSSTGLLIQGFESHGN